MTSRDRVGPRSPVYPGPHDPPCTVKRQACFKAIRSKEILKFFDGFMPRYVGGCDVFPPQGLVTYAFPLTCRPRVPPPSEWLGDTAANVYFDEEGSVVRALEATSTPLPPLEDLKEEYGPTLGATTVEEPQGRGRQGRERRKAPRPMKLPEMVDISRFGEPPSLALRLARRRLGPLTRGRVSMRLCVA